MSTENRLPRLYSELSSWWPIFSAPADYAEEAEFYRKQFVVACANPPETLLELGCGGGNNASHMKKHFEMTLVDLSPGMLAVSSSLNPECEHIQGDMREVRIGRLFDAVFIHDAITYITTEEDLHKTIETAFIHCKPGGAALFAPDSTQEMFRGKTNCGGHDHEGYSLRYLDWTWDPDPSDTIYVSDFAYLMRYPNGRMRCEYDRHILGLFSQEVWIRLINEAGFHARLVPFEHSEVEPDTHVVFLGVKPLE